MFYFWIKFLISNLVLSRQHTGVKFHSLYTHTHNRKLYSSTYKTGQMSIGWTTQTAIHRTYLKLLFGLDVLDGCVKYLWAILIGHQILLQVVLSRSHEHHPVTTVFIRKVQPHVVRLLSIFLYIQQAQLRKQNYRFEIINLRMHHLQKFSSVLSHLTLSSKMLTLTKIYFLL